MFIVQAKSAAYFIIYKWRCAWRSLINYSRTDLDSFMALDSKNFHFLNHHDPLLVKLATVVEQLCYTYPNTAILKLRQFAEALARRQLSLPGTQHRARRSRPVPAHQSESNEFCQTRGPFALFGGGLSRGGTARLSRRLARENNGRVGMQSEILRDCQKLFGISHCINVNVETLGMMCAAISTAADGWVRRTGKWR